MSTRLASASYSIRLRARAAERGLDPDGAERVFRAIIDVCVEAEEH